MVTVNRDRGSVIFRAPACAILLMAERAVPQCASLRTPYTLHRRARSKKYTHTRIFTFILCLQLLCCSCKLRVRARSLGTRGMDTRVPSQGFREYRRDTLHCVDGVEITYQHTYKIMVATIMATTMVMRARSRQCS